MTYQELLKKIAAKRERIRKLQRAIDQLQEQVPRAHAAVWCRFFAAHESTIHYSQDRPTPLYHPGDTTMTLDCSGACETIARWSGLPDPSGLGWGNGNTDSMLRVLRKIEKRNLKVADYALWHNGPNGLHVATVVEAGRDPLIMSHGTEAGPILVRLSHYSHDGDLDFLDAGK